MTPADTPLPADGPAELKCATCNHEWLGSPKPTRCPSCGTEIWFIKTGSVDLTIPDTRKDEAAGIGHREATLRAEVRTALARAETAEREKADALGLARESIEELKRQRDEARAEVERVKAERDRAEQALASLEAMVAGEYPSLLEDNSTANLVSDALDALVARETAWREADRQRMRTEAATLTAERDAALEALEPFAEAGRKFRPSDAETMKGEYFRRASTTYAKLKGEKTDV